VNHDQQRESLISAVLLVGAATSLLDTSNRMHDRRMNGHARRYDPCRPAIQVTLQPYLGRFPKRTHRQRRIPVAAQKILP
jgi:hypothetical protein